jgi:hypothetical protein
MYRSVRREASVGYPPEAMSDDNVRPRATAALGLAALGVVYGDIGTSPLYAIRECFHGPHAVAVSQGNVLGVLSLRKRNIVRTKARGLSDKDLAAEKGWRVIRNQNCRGCHQIDGEGGDFLRLVEDKALGPPILNGEGDRVQSDWLFAFLKGPTPIRPWLSVRMPTFGFPDSTASNLVRAFQATAPKGGGYEEVRPSLASA